MMEYTQERHMEEAEHVMGAFGMTEDERRHLGTNYFGEYLGRLSHGEHWDVIIADLEDRNPDHNVRELIEYVSDVNYLPWKQTH